MDKTVFSADGAVRTVALCLSGTLLFMFAGCQGAYEAAAYEAHTAMTAAMDTLVLQEAYGPGAETAMRQVNEALAAWEARLSLFTAGSDIARVNAAAGAGGADVAPETAALLRQALALSAQSEGAFAITIAPVTLAWGVTSGSPRVPGADELAALLPLVNDAAVQVAGNHVTLPQTGMALDLGGIAKGAALAIVRDIYNRNGVNSAYVNIGGNVYIHGEKPGGVPFRVGFQDPQREEGVYIASFGISNEVVAVSGGYERYFEVGGQRYIHIFEPATGSPVQSDILSVGVLHPNGAEADFWSTTLFVWGVQRTLEYMRDGGRAIMLDDAGNLYVSQSLQAGFELQAQSGYNLIFVPQEDGV